MTKDNPSLEHTQTRRGSWLMGALVLIPAILLPPRTFFYLLLVSDMNLKSLFPFLIESNPPQIAGFPTLANRQVSVGLSQKSYHLVFPLFSAIVYL
jgi:hypothetical protein